ncbi:MAG: hypothetical protein QOH71_3797 [Blastocatellia bacterium]|jgi:hypothetical protein|nr:hypothetical protein [Blastocatellia bacterium]
MAADLKHQEFVRLVEMAMKMVEGRLANQTDPVALGRLEDLLCGLRDLRERAVSGDLGPSEGVLGLGLRYAILDWGTPLDSELLGIADAIESYYQKNL